MALALLGIRGESQKEKLVSLERKSNFGKALPLKSINWCAA